MLISTLHSHTDTSDPASVITVCDAHGNGSDLPLTTLPGGSPLRFITTGPDQPVAATRVALEVATNLSMDNYSRMRAPKKGKGLCSLPRRAVDWKRMVVLIQCSSTFHFFFSGETVCLPPRWMKSSGWLGHRCIQEIRVPFLFNTRGGGAACQTDAVSRQRTAAPVTSFLETKRGSFQTL